MGPGPWATQQAGKFGRAVGMDIALKNVSRHGG